MRTSLVSLSLILSGCMGPGDGGAGQRKILAERFFRGVYGCDPAVVDELAADDLVISYPIFDTIFGRPVLRGRDAAKKLIANFCGTWADPRLIIDEAVSEENTVVLLWSFRARNVGPRPGGQPATEQDHSWGGMTLFRFNADGKIVAEIGEESDPGPVRRVGDAYPER